MNINVLNSAILGLTGNKNKVFEFIEYLNIFMRKIRFPVRVCRKSLIIFTKDKEARKRRKVTWLKYLILREKQSVRIKKMRLLRLL
jgi:hypothetical protein